MSAVIVTKKDVDRERFPYRMKDLCELTGLERQVVHFYIQKGLVPAGAKRGRNMAYYGPEHVERIKLVRQLQQERFLPLKAIKAMLEGQDDQFTVDQRALLRDVKARMGDDLGASSAPSKKVPAAPLLEEHGIERDELLELAELGMLSLGEENGELLVVEDDVWMIEQFGALRRAGFTRELGFKAGDLSLIEETVSQLFQKEMELVASRLTHLSPDEVATLVQQAVPVVNGFIARYHTTKLRQFFAALG